jgi:hypothetical protein
MFRALLSSQYQNINRLINPKVGMFRVNHIPTSWISSADTSRNVYDGSRASNIISSQVGSGIIHGCPTLLDAGDINHMSYPGKNNIEELLMMLHQAMHYSSQIGFVVSRPAKKITIEAIQKSITTPFKQNQYKKPNLIKRIQFIACWAHAYTPDWDEWSEVLCQSAEIAKQYGKPIYADLTFTYPVKTQRKPMSVNRASQMIRETHNCGFDGIIVRGYRENELDDKFRGAVIHTLNQINERSL